MQRILITALIAVAIGIVLGRTQTSMQTASLPEKFEGARPTKIDFGPEDNVTTAGTPKAEIVGGAEYKFGTMMHGETQSHVFTVRNVGDAPLKLEKSGSTCKCTTGTMDKNLLAPGEETTVTLTWTAQTAMPIYGQSATFTTNDPENTQLKFNVTGMIADSFVIEPSELGFGDIAATQATESSFYVYTYLAGSKVIKNLRWTNASTEHNVELTSEVVPVQEAPDAHHSKALMAHKVNVKILPGMPLGPLSSRIQFETDRGDEVGTLEIAVTGRVTSDISLIGGGSFDAKMSILNLGNVDPKAGASIGIFLSLQGEERNKIVPTLESWEPAESLKVTLGEPRVSASRTLIPIQVEVPKGAPPASYPGSSKDTFGKILITTNHETIKEIPIYVRLVIEE
ncbi:MAG: DUF1573 domain-containing protein [Pirellulaceae bacterium]